MVSQLEQPMARSAESAIAPRPAGGLDEQRFDWAEAWYPVHYVEDLDRDRPTAFTLLGRDLVIWWDPHAQTWRVFQDQCPHRLARLSEGRINEQGHLECPYHGWAFSGDGQLGQGQLGQGQCEVIPQQPEGGQAHTSVRACVQGSPTVVRQGLLFVYGGKPENAASVTVPVIEPMETDPDGWVCLNMFRDLPYDALTLLENVLDPSHLPYTHHRSVGNRANAGPVELDLLEFGKQGFTGVWPEGPRRGKLGSQDTTFIAPNLMWHDLTSKQFGRTLTVVYATPIGPGRCRLFARFPFKFSSKIPAFVLKLTPRWYSHLGNHGVLEDDQIFLHFQERYLAERGGSENFAKAFYLPTKADSFVSALRRWVNEFAGPPFPNQPLPPAQSREQLLDRYASHTQHCASCRGALKRMKQGRQMAWAVAAVAWSLAPGVAVALNAILPVVVLSGLGLTGAGLGWVLQGWERRFYEGQTVPMRNQS